MSPKDSPSLVNAAGPSWTITSRAPGKKNALTMTIDANNTIGIRSEASIGLSNPADQPARRTIARRGTSAAGGRANDASRTSPSARSFVIGLRRCSQLSPER